MVIGFDPEFATEREEVRVPRNHRALVHVLSAALGREVTVVVEVLKSKEQLLHEQAVQERRAANDEVGRKVQKVGRSTMSREDRAAWIENSAVRRVLETFSGDIVDIRG